MKNLVGSKVWVVEYGYPDCADCNGVFSTREKALASIDADFERCKDFWFNRELVDDDDINSADWIIWEFDLIDDKINLHERVGVNLYLTEIL